jgi:mannose-6-phosphate isomerase-like protein (cupin superfamily)
MRHFLSGVAAHWSAASAAVVLAAACAAPDGSARVEVDLPDQGQHLNGTPVAAALIHGDDDVSVSLMKISGPVAMHRHAKSEELVYLVAGEGVLHLANSQRALRAGDLVVVPRNTPHGFTPTGTEPLVILQTFVPHFIEGDRTFEPETKADAKTK